jgi:hypothetical protein
MLNSAKTPTVLRNRSGFWRLVKPLHCNDARHMRENMVGAVGEVGGRGDFAGDGFD